MTKITIKKREYTVYDRIHERHLKMEKVKIGLSSLAVGLVMGFTPYMFTLADQIRGHAGTGGEIFFPFTALAAVGIIEYLTDSYTAKKDAEDAGLLQ